MVNVQFIRFIRVFLQSQCWNEDCGGAECPPSSSSFLSVPALTSALMLVLFVHQVVEQTPFVFPLVFWRILKITDSSDLTPPLFPPCLWSHLTECLQTSHHTTWSSVLYAVNLIYRGWFFIYHLRMRDIQEPKGATASEVTVEFSCLKKHSYTKCCKMTKNGKKMSKDRHSITNINKIYLKKPQNNHIWTTKWLFNMQNHRLNDHKAGCSAV